jgi:hypothetical protein
VLHTPPPTNEPVPLAVLLEPLTTDDAVPLAMLFTPPSRLIPLPINEWFPQAMLQLKAVPPLPINE